MRIRNQANLSSQRIAEIEAELTDQENLKDVMNWALSYPAGTFIPQVVADVVVQDGMMLLFHGARGLCSSMTQREWVVSRQSPCGIIF